MIHSTSIISNKAQLGESVNIGPYCIVDDNVKIGDKIQSRFYKGTIESTVCKIRRKESQD